MNGPDDCSEDKNALKCPAITRNLEGSIGIRLLIAESIAPAGHVVPFYFQPTLGGSDINGNLSLGSYQDYRFRAPNVLLLRGSFEHSIYGPLGFSFMVDEGKVATTRGNVNFTHLAHSYSAGLTLRAGGFPVVYLQYAWGGNEGTHTTGAMNTSTSWAVPLDHRYSKESRDGSALRLTWNNLPTTTTRFFLQRWERREPRLMSPRRR